MLRSIFELPGVIADYTVGTVIVLIQLALAERSSHEAGSLGLMTRGR